MLATLPLADFPLAAESQSLSPVALAGLGKNFAGGSGTLTYGGPILGFIDAEGEDSPSQ